MYIIYNLLFTYICAVGYTAIIEWWKQQSFPETGVQIIPKIIVTTVIYQQKISSVSNRLGDSFGKILK